MDDRKTDRSIERLIQPLIERIEQEPGTADTSSEQIRAAIYARRSITDPEYDSIGIQIAKASQHCETVGAYCDLKKQVFVDRHRSGRTMNAREGLGRMLSAIAAGTIDIVIVKGIDRITRSHRDAVLLEEFFKRYGVALHVAGQGVVNDLTLILGSFQAQKDHDAIRERMIAGQYKADRAGRLIGRYAIYGYDRSDEWPFLKINEEQAAIIRRAFAEIDGGATPFRVARGFNRDGIRGPKGGKWHRLIRKKAPFSNPILKGLYKSSDDEGPIEFSVPSLKIIEPDCFDRVVEKFDKKIRLKKNAAYSALFITPELRCRCGGVINPSRRNVHDFARCRLHEMHGGCTVIWQLRTSEIARRILRFALDELLDPERAAEWAEIRQAGLERRYASIRPERNAIAAEIEEIDRRMDVDPNLGFQPNSLDALAQRHRLELRQVQLIDALVALEPSRPDAAPSKEDDSHLCDALKQMLVQLPLQKFDTIEPGVIDRVRQLLPRVMILTDDAGLSYELRFLIGIPGVPESDDAPSLSDPRWVIRTYPRPADDPLDFPEVVIAHHERSCEEKYKIADEDWRLISHFFGSKKVHGCDPRLVADAMYFIEIARLSPKLLPERYQDVSDVVEKLNALRFRQKMFTILRREGSVVARQQLGPARRGRWLKHATPIV